MRARANPYGPATNSLDLASTAARICYPYYRMRFPVWLFKKNPISYSTTGDIMKTRICTLLLTTLVGSFMLLGSGCTKKQVIPPDANAGFDSGKTISYPPGEGSGFSQDNMPSEGTLDDTTRNGAAGMGDNASDEYKRLHGRSSEGLSPVYFDFDQATIRPDMVDRMVLNAEYMKQAPNAYVIVEGNTDERGTNEYNLALAERRAQNTRQYLVELGIDSARLRTVSYGEERPLFPGQDEDSYAQNRRADFVVE